jgi:hypothetical protein
MPLDRHQNLREFVLLRGTHLFSDIQREAVTLLFCGFITTKSIKWSMKLNEIDTTTQKLCDGNVCPLPSGLIITEDMHTCEWDLYA